MSSISYILPQVIYHIMSKLAHSFFFFNSAYMTSLKIKFSIILHSFFLAGEEDSLVLFFLLLLLFALLKILVVCCGKVFYEALASS